MFVVVAVCEIAQEGTEKDAMRQLKRLRDLMGASSTFTVYLYNERV